MDNQPLFRKQTSFSSLAGCQ